MGGEPVPDERFEQTHPGQDVPKRAGTLIPRYWIELRYRATPNKSWQPTRNSIDFMRETLP